VEPIAKELNPFGACCFLWIRIHTLIVLEPIKHNMIHGHSELKERCSRNFSGAWSWNQQLSVASDFCFRR